jgi:hypothetical protein
MPKVPKIKDEWILYGIVLFIAEGDWSLQAFIPPSSLNSFCGGQAGKPGRKYPENPACRAVAF